MASRLPLQEFSIKAIFRTISLVAISVLIASSVVTMYHASTRQLLPSCGSPVLWRLCHSGMDRMVWTRKSQILRPPLRTQLRLGSVDQLDGECDVVLLCCKNNQPGHLHAWLSCSLFVSFDKRFYILDAPIVPRCKQSLWVPTAYCFIEGALGVLLREDWYPSSGKCYHDLVFLRLI